MSTIQELILEATKNCQLLTELLLVENEAVRAREMKVIEDNISVKDKLASRIMALLSHIKKEREVTPKDPSLAPYLATLQDAFDGYQREARKNALLLSSAHESTAVFLDTVRQVVEAAQPRAATYGSGGEMQEKRQETATIIRTTV